MDIFVDEQNGFRRNLNQSVFAAFIDMEKVFNRINRHLLMYRFTTI